MNQTAIAWGVAAALAATLPSSAWATALLYSAPARSGFPVSQTMNCDIVNVGAAAMDIGIQILSYNGTIVNSVLKHAVAPNTGTNLQDASGNGAWCKFGVTGEKADVRAAAVYSNSNGYLMTIPAE